MEPFKNIYNKESIQSLAIQIQGQSKNFNQIKFKKEIFKELEFLEMKDRVRLIADSFHKYGETTALKNIALIVKVTKNTSIEGFLLWPFSQYLEKYGKDRYEQSMKAIHLITQKFTGEFAIRPFLKLNDKKAFSFLEKWQKDKSHHVRRLVSEGTRPHLPWGMKVSKLTENLERNIKLISPLRFDSSEYVRKSVANHLNDISHLNAELFLKTLTEWKKDEKKTQEIDWIIRHASRTLLKKGHTGVLKLHGYNPRIKVKSSFSIGKNSIKEGDKILLNMKIKALNKSSQKIIIEYIIHYLKSNGDHSPKVFRYKDTILPAQMTQNLKKEIHFKKVTTRRHYPGVHYIEMKINGQSQGKKKFILESIN